MTTEPERPRPTTPPDEETDADGTEADEDRASDEGMPAAPAAETPGGRNADIDRLLSDDSPR